MADIFISYAREDAEQAHQFSEALAGLGWSVWWDDSIRAGSPFDQVIDEQLDSAICVIVIWSSASVTSKWVRAEASAADDQGKLVPVCFERGLRLPVQFRQLQVTQLTSTNLFEETDEVGGLLADLASRIGKPPQGMERGLVESHRGERSSGAYLVTAGEWRLTVRFLGFRSQYDLTLHPNGAVSGRGKWGPSRANIAGHWMFGAAEQVLHLDLSGGIQEGTKSVPVNIVRWETADAADCKFEGRRARLERVAPEPTRPPIGIGFDS